jgi:hypothetical protein
MKTYAYRVYRSTINNPIYGGTVKAENMDSAAQIVVERNGVKVIHEIIQGYDYHRFELNGSEVGILIYVNPEEL